MVTVYCGFSSYRACQSIHGFRVKIARIRTLKEMLLRLCRGPSLREVLNLPKKSKHPNTRALRAHPPPQKKINACLGMDFGT